jgi:hypothetical protein
MNRPLKTAIVLQFGSQVEAAQALGLHESRLSQILHYRIAPSAKERRALARVFGAEKLDSLLGGGKERPQVAGIDNVPAESAS